MPNGGLHNCTNCLHYSLDAEACSLRDKDNIDFHTSRWTTCANCGKEGEEAVGPICVLTECYPTGWGSCDNELPWHGGMRPKLIGACVDLFDVQGVFIQSFDSVQRYLKFCLDEGVIDTLEYKSSAYNVDKV